MRSLGRKGSWRKGLSSRESIMSQGPEKTKLVANYREFTVAGTGSLRMKPKSFQL